MTRRRLSRQSRAFAEPALAEARVVRTILLVLGVAVPIYALLSAGQIRAQAEYVHPAWLVSALLVTFGVPPVLALVAGLLPLTTLRIVVGAYAIAFLTIVATWIPAMEGLTMPPEPAPWPLALMALGTLPAAIAWRPPIAWLAVFVNAALLALVRYFAVGGENLAVSLQDGVFGIAFCSIFTIVVIVVVRNARALDSIAVTARANAAGAASVAARLHEQARLDALVHDEVISALYYATAQGGAIEESVRRQARRALDELSRLDDDRTDSVPISGTELSNRLRAVLFDLSSSTVVVVLGERRSSIPAAVADAFAEGATEALRNSLRHAGGDTVSRRVILRLAEPLISVQITDNGSGFDPAAVNPYRLGILVSIRARLAAVEGGSASVDSAPGRGTRVTLRWRQP